MGGGGLEKLQCCCVGGGGGRERKLQDNLAFRLGEGRMLVTSALKTLYGGQFTLSTRLEKTNMFELCKAGKVLPRLFG